ncbi:MAG: polysaccharide deacetylase family protein [Bacteroidetes bacterium]|nr:polysaccharide deacetylase family protein [Bacteroidota bacterium]
MKKIFSLFLTACLFCIGVFSQSDSTYAEKLGYPRGTKLLILHVDDVGMSFDSNEGAINAITKGVASSLSIMMPCPWVPAFVQYMKAHPGLDAGLHLTLTSEWKGYRWGPLSGKNTTPGLVDAEGALWPGVNDVVQHASGDEVEKEIRAQLERARSMGFEPTHFDTHMGTLLATPEFTQRYVKLGIDNQIPVMLPAGHATLIKAQMHAPEEQIQQMRMIGNLLWKAGLPVLDDLHNESYGWPIPKEIASDDAKLQAYKTKKYIEGVRSLKPGLTMMIMHCTATSDVFPHISDSGPVRRGDMLAMMDPALRKAIQDEKIIITTWREMMERRKKVK